MSDLLSGVRVLESAVLLNGDTLGMLLGDLGADVIKVETPPAGDYLRDILGQIEPRHSPAHLQANKNKRSIALDLGSDGGREVLVGSPRGRRCVRRRLHRGGLPTGSASATSSSSAASPTSSTASTPASARSAPTPGCPPTAR